MHKLSGPAVLLTMLFATTYVWADEDGSYVNYDNIVNELKASAEDVPAPLIDDGWDDVAIHGSLALATSYVGVTSPNGAGGAGLLKGIQFGFGMNLFTRVLRVEGAFSSYAQEALDADLKASLKEFELRFVYLPPLQEGTILRIGAGLTARYMNLDSNAKGSWTNYQASTPSSLLLLGFERKISKNIAVGPDLSYRSAVVADTFDKSAWDASFRLNATF